VPEQPITAEPTPATPIGGMKDWLLHIQCGQCRRHGVLRLDSIAERFGSRLRIAEAIRRLRCSGCRGMPKLVTLVKVATYGKSTRKLREIVVLDRPIRP
jgi:hypothetical protein